MSALPSALPSVLPVYKVCKVCGRPLQDRTGLRGRPSDFCAPPPGQETSPCARLDKRFSEIKGLTRNLVADMEDEGCDPTLLKQRLQKLKGYMWSEANAATNKGNLVGAPDRKQYGKTRSGWWRLAPEMGPRKAPSFTCPRGTCPVCNADVAVRGGGILNKHRVVVNRQAGAICDGSGKRLLPPA